MDVTRGASTEGEGFHFHQEKQGKFYREAVFDLGLEEGAEFQDRKLGKRIWPLRIESIGKVQRFFADQVSPCSWVLFIGRKQSKVGMDRSLYLQSLQ